MNSPLQKGPDGLLGLLDLKTLGRNPNEFPNTLQGTVECREFYLLRERRVTSANGAFVAINTAIGTVTVPNDEVWRVNSIGLFFQRNVADIALNIDQFVALRRMSGATASTVFQTRLEPVAATDLQQYRGNITELWLAPGDQLRSHISTTITAGATSQVLTVDYNRMPSG